MRNKEILWPKKALSEKVLLGFLSYLYREDFRICCFECFFQEVLAICWPIFRGYVSFRESIFTCHFWLSESHEKEHVYQKDWAIIPPQKISCLIWSLSSILELPIYTVYIIYIYIYVYIPGPGTSLHSWNLFALYFGGWKPPKHGILCIFQSKQRVICVQGNMYIYILYYLFPAWFSDIHQPSGECGWQVHEQQEFESNHFLGPLGSNRQNPQNPRRWGGKQLEYGKVQPCQMALGTSKSGYKTLGISAISPCKKLVYIPPCFLDIYLLIY